ncbi:Hypp1711 [Branchiostoma lanceolatum]|uniref:Hypp1711 protein n=1 Tax=Branchiostoma lanceolatum TaxID=7740 RepID=A0A8J9ZME2_BRALA|nr:Hypp1711 [Branchiostoma lanceolatum]
MLNWLKKVNPPLQRPTTPGLPSLADTENPRASTAANRGGGGGVPKVIVAMTEEEEARELRSSGQKIAKMHIAIGPQKTTDRMSAEVDR